jgi:hypothetical protein
MRNWATVGLAWLALGLCWGVLAGDQFTFDPNLQPQFHVVVEQVDSPPAAPVIEEPFFVFFTAGPLCGPCIRWEANEHAKVLKAGYSVVKVDIRNPGKWDSWVQYYNINTGPRFFMVERKHLKAVEGKGPWIGFTPAATLILAAGGKPEAVPAPVQRARKNTRLTCAEIKNLVRERYRGNEITTDVSPQSNVWNHLTDGSHGTHTFTRDQVSCLYLWEALCLHDDAHGARAIRPE